MVYLDNAATTGVKPRNVISAVSAALSNMSVNPSRGGYTKSIEAAEYVLNCRRCLKDMFGASSENSVCFLSSCTHAINTVLYGLLKAGDHVIISSLEHNAVVRTVYKMYVEYGIKYSIAKVEIGDDDKTVRNFAQLINPNTKLVITTAASNVIGVKLPIKKIGQLCRNNGILYCLDGAQAAGVSEIKMDDMDIDYLCIAPHKGLYAPMGIGVLIAEKPLNRILITGGTGVNSVSVTQPDDFPERIESGTINLPGIAGLKAGIDFVNGKGIKNIEAYEYSLCRYAYEKLKTIGATLYGGYPDIRTHTPVLSFNVGDYHSDDMGTELSKNGVAVRCGLHCAPLAHKQIGTIERGTVRISPSVFNSKQDIDSLIFILKRII